MGSLSQPEASGLSPGSNACGVRHLLFLDAILVAFQGHLYGLIVVHLNSYDLFLKDVPLVTLLPLPDLFFLSTTLRDPCRDLCKRVCVWGERGSGLSGCNLLTGAPLFDGTNVGGGQKIVMDTVS